MILPSGIIVEAASSINRKGSVINKNTGSQMSLMSSKMLMNQTAKTRMLDPKGANIPLTMAVLRESESAMET